jgi:hypothetical protein
MISLASTGVTPLVRAAPRMMRYCVWAWEAQAVTVSAASRTGSVMGPRRR